MEVGSVYVKIVGRKPQNSSKAVQYMVLAGFDPRLTQTSATYVETLGPTSTLTEDEVYFALEKARIKNNAKEITDLTPGGVTKKLQKLFEAQALPESDVAPAGEKTFSQMGIGQYL